MRGRTAAVLGYVIDDAREELLEILGNLVDPWSLTDGQVVELIETEYPGGWDAFLRASAV
jgi:hypothetical protein